MYSLAQWPAGTSPKIGVGDGVSVSVGVGLGPAVGLGGGVAVGGGGAAGDREGAVVAERIGDAQFVDQAVEGRVGRSGVVFLGAEHQEGIVRVGRGAAVGVAHIPGGPEGLA